MIDQLSPITAHNIIKTEAQNGNISTARHKTLRWVENDRMAGMVPSWGYAATPADQTKIALETALNGGNSEAQSFENALAYNASSEATTPNPEEFGFGDILDMINPLQHIPLVNYAYREITGDEIKPISQIIGGGVFGGGLGLAGSLVNIMLEEETGQNLINNALSLASIKEPPERPTMQKIAQERSEEPEINQKLYAHQRRTYNS